MFESFTNFFGGGNKEEKGRGNDGFDKQTVPTNGAELYDADLKEVNSDLEIQRIEQEIIGLETKPEPTQDDIDKMVFLRNKLDVIKGS